jgi:translation initiation factor IF-3
VNHRCNEQIRISPVRVIDENNEQLGVMPTDEAMSRARSAGMDLVEIAPTERPPVCRIMDYGKFKYGQKRRKQKSREQKLKEIRLHPDIGDHDRNIKLNQAVGFIEKGDKVQFTMIFRGRERFHQNLGFEMFNSIVEGLGERPSGTSAPQRRPSVIMVMPRQEGRYDRALKEAAGLIR